MIDPVAVNEFLSHHRFAVVGASPNPRAIGNVVYRELKAHGYDTVAVNPNHDTIADEPCYPDLASVPGDLDGVVVIVHRSKSADVVTECNTLGVRRVWLFQGLGGEGAVSDAAVGLCGAYGIEVIDGACPLMFLEPVGWFHRIHRAARRMNRSLAKAS